MNTENKAIILIVDDTPENLDVLKGLLGSDYNLKVAVNGKIALKIANLDPHPDLILLDIMMPVMDGYEACGELKASPATRDIPVIFITAKTETDDIVKGFEVGAIDYVTKPFNPPELMARVQTQLMIKQQRDEIAEKNVQNKELLHVLAHDLANHFAILQMSLQAIEVLPHKLESYKEKMNRAVVNGIDVINLVREMRAMEAKGIELSSINLLDTVKESQNLISEKLEAKKIDLSMDIDPTIAVIAEKRSLVNSVINNVLTNAIKFSFEGSAITISAVIEDSLVKLSICDSGIGIPVNMLENLFDVSKSTSRTGTNGEKGTGFGMPLMKKFVELYGGSVEVKSRTKDEYPDDHGTEFIIQLKTA
jgi:CheY-like chemotaxis protein